MIDKGFLRKDSFLASSAFVRLFKGRKMGFNIQIMTEKKILYSAVFAITADCINNPLRILLMTIDYLFEHFSIINKTSSNFGGGYYLLLSIYTSMCFVSQF